MIVIAVMCLECVTLSSAIAWLLIRFKPGQSKTNGRREDGDYGTGLSPSQTQLTVDAPELTAVNRPESLSYTHFQVCSIVRSARAIGKKEEKKDARSSQWDRGADGELFVGRVMHSHQHSHILSYGMARTVIFVIRCGSYIHTWWVPAAVILGFTVTTLWYFKAGAPIGMKFSVYEEKGVQNKAAAETVKNVNAVLPIKTIKVYVIVF